MIESARKLDISKDHNLLIIGINNSLLTKLKALDKRRASLALGGKGNRTPPTIIKRNTTMILRMRRLVILNRNQNSSKEVVLYKKEKFPINHKLQADIKVKRIRGNQGLNLNKIVRFLRNLNLV